MSAYAYLEIYMIIIHTVVLLQMSCKVYIRTTSWIKTISLI